MQTREKIGIAIIIVLVIILGISVWFGQISNPKVSINCQTACRQIGPGKWFLSGAGPDTKKIFSTEDDCIYTCHFKYKK